MPRERRKRGPARIYPWHKAVLRLVLANPGITAPEIGERLYAKLPSAVKPQVAWHELCELRRLGLVVCKQGSPLRWSPSLLAAMTGIW
jgi:hypothetical protein